MTTPATNVEMLEVVARSGLLPAEMVSEYAARYAAAATPAGPHTLLTHLLHDGVITQFHARFLAAGKYKGFFLGGKYKLLEHLGSGGMGEVYLGEQLILQRLVAIKLLKAPKDSVDNGGALQRFFREARAAATLRHPNIAQLYDVDSSGSNPYMVMEYLDGSNLHAVVAEHGQLSIPRAVHYAAQAARGLAHAHAVGLVHRDIKPGNLMLQRDGTVKVLDLGLARYLTEPAKNQNLTATYDDNMLIGTADFIAPEQTQDSSAVDQRVDIYSLGGALYFFLTGRGPFEEGTIAQKLLWHQLKPPPPVTVFRPEVPAGLVAVLDRMMAKDRDQRYTTATEVEAALAPWFDPHLPPPPAAEMPRVKADQYRIGLVESAPQFDRPGGTPARTATGEPRSGSIVDITAPPAAVPAAPAPPAPQTATPGRRRRSLGGTLLFFGVQVSLLAITAAVTLFLYEKYHPKNDPNRKALPNLSTAPPSPIPAGGSSLIEPLMKRWVYDHSPESPRVAYEGVGSPVGVKGVRSGEYQFACTDVPLAPSEVRAAAAEGKAIIQVPISLSAVVPVYHLKDAPDDLRLDGETLAGMYLGEITYWDDPRVAKLNGGGGVKLPHTPVVPVYRSGSSGTNALFTHFLSLTSEAWRVKYGTVSDFKPEVPTARGAKKNAEVPDVTLSVNGAIGYLEPATAKLTELREARVKNAAGRYQPPSPTAVLSAARGFDLSDPAKWSIIHPTGDPDAYPIAGFIWVVFDANAADREQLRDTLDFLLWVVTTGQSKADKLRYVPLPTDVARRSRAELERVRDAITPK